MSDGDAWAWRRSRPRKPSPDDQAYAERVTRNKRKAAKQRWERERSAESKAIKARNLEPEW